MEIRVLRYFLESARTGSITRAAERLHVTQPTLSRQLKGLEEELGKKLFVRGSTSIRLTDEGRLLKERAEDILSMVDLTAAEFKVLDDFAGGDLHIGCAESQGIRHLARAVHHLQQRYPRIRLHLHSGNAENVTERLDRGLLEFAVIVRDVDASRYNSLEIPHHDAWGLILRQDDPMAAKAAVRLEDLMAIPLICSRQSLESEYPKWFGDSMDKLNIVATYNLLFNAAVMVREGLGCALGFDHLVDTGPESGLCFRPLEPALLTPMHLVWRKHQTFTPAGQLLLDEMHHQFKTGQGQ